MAVGDSNKLLNPNIFIIYCSLLYEKVSPLHVINVKFVTLFYVIAIVIPYAKNKEAMVLASVVNE